MYVRIRPRVMVQYYYYYYYTYGSIQRFKNRQYVINSRNEFSNRYYTSYHHGVYYAYIFIVQRKCYTIEL